MTNADHSQTAHDHLLQLATLWVAHADKMRADADISADKLWGARQYGLADTREDIAEIIRKRIKSISVSNLCEQLLSLSVQMRVMAETSSETGMTMAYRRGCADGYRAAVDDLRRLNGAENGAMNDEDDD
jgi:hypothetical protein